MRRCASTQMQLSSTISSRNKMHASSRIAMSRLSISGMFARKSSRTLFPAILSMLRALLCQCAPTGVMVFGRFLIPFLSFTAFKLSMYFVPLFASTGLLSL